MRRELKITADGQHFDSVELAKAYLDKEYRSILRDVARQLHFVQPRNFDTDAVQNARVLDHHMGALMRAAQLSKESLDVEDSPELLQLLEDAVPFQERS
jgi:hypothetical protein